MRQPELYFKIATLSRQLVPPPSHFLVHLGLMNWSTLGAGINKFNIPVSFTQLPSPTKLEGPSRCLALKTRRLKANSCPLHRTEPEVSLKPTGSGASNSVSSAWKAEENSVDLSENNKPLSPGKAWNQQLSGTELCRDIVAIDDGTVNNVNRISSLNQ